MSWFRGLFGQTFSVEDVVSEEEKSQPDNSDSNSVAPKRRAAASRAPQDLTKQQRLAEMEKRARTLTN